MPEPGVLFLSPSPWKVTCLSRAPQPTGLRTRTHTLAAREAGKVSICSSRLLEREVDPASHQNLLDGGVSQI